MANDCAQVLVNRLEDEACPGKIVTKKTDLLDMTLLVLTVQLNFKPTNVDSIGIIRYCRM